jgi:hypothetical protein
MIRGRVNRAAKQDERGGRAGDPHLPRVPQGLGAEVRRHAPNVRKTVPQPARSIHDGRVQCPDRSVREIAGGSPFGSSHGGQP